MAFAFRNVGWQLAESAVSVERGLLSNTWIRYDRHVRLDEFYCKCSNLLCSDCSAVLAKEVVPRTRQIIAKLLKSTAGLPKVPGRVVCQCTCSAALRAWNFSPNGSIAHSP